MSENHQGGCLCGSVRYRAVGAPVAAMVCHCRFCQRRTGSAFAEAVHFSAGPVDVSGGPLCTYAHRSDESGRWLRMQFCPTCGTTVMRTVERRPGVIAIAGGTFDDPDWFGIQRHIWTGSAQSWVSLPAETECFEKGAAS